MVVCLERGADLHMAQLMPLPLTVSWFSKIQIGFTFLVPAYPGCPGQRAFKRVCVCKYVWVSNFLSCVFFFKFCIERTYIREPEFSQFTLNVKFDIRC